MDYTNTTIMVTGASSGLGAAFARELARRGANLVLVARRASVLQELAAELQSEFGRSATVVPLDLAEEGSGARLLAEVSGRSIVVDSVINCAGVGLTRGFVETEPTDISKQIAVNVSAVVEISRAFLPQLLASGAGALVNVASLTAFMPTPRMAVYAASKAFVLSFTEALAWEHRSSTLTVMALSPGPTKTDFYRSSGTSESQTRFETPEQVVAVALRALDHPRPPISVVSGRTNSLISRLMPVLPRRIALRLASSPSS